MDTARKLMNDWRRATQQQQGQQQQHQHEQEKGQHNGVTVAANGSANAAGTAAAAAVPSPLSPAPSLSPPSASGGSSSGRGVAPGSFLGLMLAARDRSSGSGLTDDQVRRPPSLLAHTVPCAVSLSMACASPHALWVHGRPGGGRAEGVCVALGAARCPTCAICAYM